MNRCPICGRRVATPADEAAIRERLREVPGFQAQAQLTALRTEAERLKDDQQTYADTYARNMARVNAENERLRNVADLLRIACEGIAEREPIDPMETDPRVFEAEIDHVRHIARGAIIAADAMK